MFATTHTDPGMPDPLDVLTDRQRALLAAYADGVPALSAAELLAEAEEAQAVAKAARRNAEAVDETDPAAALAAVRNVILSATVCLLHAAELHARAQRGDLPPAAMIPAPHVTRH